MNKKLTFIASLMFYLIFCSFQIFAEKILFYSDLYSHKFKWFIMTSIDNYDTTVNFFIENNYFNMNKENIFFFKQGINPTVTSKSGDLILKTKNELFMNPNGHGGILGALTSQGYISKMEHWGIEYLSYFQVDNPLINMADPYFIGCHIAECFADRIDDATDGEGFTTEEIIFLGVCASAAVIFSSFVFYRKFYKKRFTKRKK